MSTESNACLVERQKQVPSQVEQLGLAISSLHDSVSILQDKLSNVSQNQPEDPSATGKEPEVLCDLASAIRNHKDSVQMAGKRLDDIINCLEN